MMFVKLDIVHVIRTFLLLRIPANILQLVELHTLYSPINTARSPILKTTAQELCPSPIWSVGRGINPIGVLSCDYERDFYIDLQQIVIKMKIEIVLS